MAPVAMPARARYVSICVCMCNATACAYVCALFVLCVRRVCCACAVCMHCCVCLSVSMLCMPRRARARVCAYARQYDKCRCMHIHEDHACRISLYTHLDLVATCLHMAGPPPPRPRRPALPQTPQRSALSGAGPQEWTWAHVSPPQIRVDFRTSPEKNSGRTTRRGTLYPSLWHLPFIFLVPTYQVISF